MGRPAVVGRPVLFGDYVQKTKLVLDQHSVLKGENVIEVWYQGDMIATIAGADGAGIRIISRHVTDKDMPIRTCSGDGISIITVPFTRFGGCKY